jgi:hypothetical protein
MQKYKDKDNDSGIVAYEIGDDYIRVEYESGDIFHLQLRKSRETKSGKDERIS